MTIKSEAETILNFFKEQLGMTREGDEIRPGYYVDGLEAAKWMDKRGIPSWKEVEWPGFFIKHIAQDYFGQHSELGLRPFKEGKKYRLMGDYLWDIRFHDVEKDPIIILTDANDFERDIRINNGIGIIILNASVTPDKDDKYRKAIEELKGGPSKYEQRRRLEGAPIRTRKAGFFGLWAATYFILPKDITGDTETWLMSNFQKNMRNSDDKPRNPKYFIYMENIPDEKEVARVNLNMDPKDFKEYFK